MKSQPMRLPWTLQDVSHAILDILRGCNIRCRDCFNSGPARIKSLAEIESDLDTLLRLRKLQSLSIVGGEVTLHPDLVEIVRLVKSRGVCVELFSNGLDLERGLLAQLKDAGTSTIFLHIESHQRRPDLPADATVADLRKLRAEKAALIAAHGMEAGLVVTVYPDKLAELEEAVSFTLQSPHLCYLLVTLWRDVNAMPALEGSLDLGLHAAAEGNNHRVRNDSLNNRMIRSLMTEHFQLAPFAFLGSNVDSQDPRWLSYVLGSVHCKGERIAQSCLRPTVIERGFLELTRWLTGRYPFYVEQNPRRFALQLLLNGLAGGNLAGNLKLLFHARRPGTSLTTKRLLFQCAAELDAQGRLIHCRCCPDAVVREGRLVPLCISDRVVTGNQKPEPNLAGKEHV